jgi:RHS repeat-associated protein
VYKSGSGTSVTTLHDESGHWIGDYDVNGQPIQQAVWMDDLPVGLLVGAGANQKLYYIEADALGTPRVVIDPGRNVAVWRWDLAGEAFGNNTPNEDPDGDGTAFVFDMRFPGQRHDSATGMNYNYFRDYDAATGRYVQSDPIGLGGGISTYGYVRARPLLMSDFFGLADMILLATGAPGMEYALHVDVPGFYTVVAHGSDKGRIVKDSDKSPLTPMELAEKIRSAPNYVKGTPVALLACRTGGSRYAQELATALGVDVLSPNRLVYGYEDGRYEIAEPNDPADGHPNRNIPGRMLLFIPIAPVARPGFLPINVVRGGQ